MVRKYKTDRVRTVRKSGHGIIVSVTGVASLGDKFEPFKQKNGDIILVKV